MLKLGLGIDKTTKKIAAFDADAQAFFNRVTAAGGTLTATEQTAVNTLVLELKGYSIWSSMKAIYPMVGASAAACAQNLKSSSFTGTFTSGWTFASSGVTPNGTSAYFNTTLIPSTSLSVNSTHQSLYLNTNNVATSSDPVDMGSFNSSIQRITLVQSSLAALSFASANLATLISTTQTTRLGFGITSKTSATLTTLYKNNTSLTSGNSGGTLPSFDVYIGNLNFINNPYVSGYTNNKIAFSSIGDGLNNTQAGNFYTAVQTFNTTLSRAVGPQLVSDADAQAYIYRVYAAGGTLTNTEATAVNQLTIDMKASNVWTSMKAVYPMIGSSAAACAQNLKSSSYTGTFTSGWTFTTSGASTIKGSGSYMNTGILASTQLSLNNSHISYYNNIALVGDQHVVIGDGTLSNGAWLGIYQASALIYSSIGCTFDSTSNASSLGYFLTNKPNSTNIKFIKNSTILTTNTPVNTSFTSVQNLFLNNYDNAVLFSSGARCAISSIGDGLTDLQASDFYTNVQTFNTTLSRQV